MRSTILRCGACRASMAVPGAPGAGIEACPVCHTPSWTWRFPAFYQARDANAGLPLLDEGESSCMNHPQKRAVSVCDGCGKFLCALCEVDWNGENLCPACIRHRTTSVEADAYQREYIHYDVIALGVVVLCVPLWVFGGLLAPVALFMGWRFWRKPLRPVPHTRAFLIVAIVLAMLIIIAWMAFALFMFLNL